MKRLANPPFMPSRVCSSFPISCHVPVCQEDILDLVPVPILAPSAALAGLSTSSTIQSALLSAIDQASATGRRLSLRCACAH